MDPLDHRLSTLAGDSLDRVAAAVEVDEDLAAVLLRTTDRPIVEVDRTRSWVRSAVAATLVLFVAGAVTILATRDGGEEVVARLDAPVATSSSNPSSDQAATLPSTTIGPVTTQEPSPAVAEPSIVAAGWSVSITPSSEVRRTCRDIVSVALRTDHEVVPVGLITPTGWDTTSPSTIPACEGVRSSGPVRVTVPDLEHGEYWFCIAGGDTREGCASVTVASVTTTTASTAPSTTVAPTSTALPIGYFERSPLLDEQPYFEIRQVLPDQSGTSTLADAEVDQLLRREIQTGVGGTVRLLPEEQPYGRCDARQVVSTEQTGVTPELTGAVRSLAAADGVVVVGVDVCPEGTVWGDDGTRFELRRIDLVTGATTVLHVREPGDGDTFFEDADVVYAGGELVAESVSPDGAYVAVAEPYTTEDTRYHVFDAVAGGDPIELDSACDDPRDLVGPPRFVGDGMVVVARECSPVGIEIGGLIVELVSLETRQPVWSVEVDHVDIDSYSRTVSLSARSIDGQVWALVSGSAGVEQPIRAAAVTAGVEQPLPDDTIVAFDPRELIHPWDPYPS